MSDSNSRIGGQRNLIFGLVGLTVALLALIFTYRSGLHYMASVQWMKEEYSHGPMIPFIALFLLVRLRKDLFAAGWRGAWIGVFLVALSSIIFVAGELSSLFIIIQYAFLLAIGGLAFSLLGWRGIFVAAAPLIYLAFMIPLPDFLYNNLSAKLQLVSSELGVAVIRFFGISVFLEGNVIDLGEFQLQVVEACSGLRYLFPLMSFGFLLAYLFHAPMWQRALIFLTTIPITVFMNSFRIGVIGVLVDKWGPGQAEGFLHDFEGWIIFMACVAILFILMKLLMIVTGDKRDLREAFGIDGGESVSREQVEAGAIFTSPFFVAVGVILLTAMASPYLENREEVFPERQRFTSFGNTIGDWVGRNSAVEQSALDTLKLDDYLSMDFTDPNTSNSVNTWVAYYSTQRKGVAIHSPKTCLPGGGWQIEKFTQIDVDGISQAVGGKVSVNRAVMAQGDSRMLVYYWFKQRERNITSEYHLKWFLFWDSLTRQRTDGALMRLIITIPDHTKLDQKNWSYKISCEILTSDSWNTFQIKRGGVVIIISVAVNMMARINNIATCGAINCRGQAR